LFWEEISNSLGFRLEQADMDDAGQEDLCKYYVSKMSPLTGILDADNIGLEVLKTGFKTNTAGDSYQSISYLVVFMNAFFQQKPEVRKRMNLAIVDKLIKRLYPRDMLLEISQKIGSDALIGFLKSVTTAKAEHEMDQPSLVQIFKNSGFTEIDAKLLILIASGVVNTMGQIT
jgi:hypothetical protein